ncbi:ImmA/IrrE family metallo-endopeptidase [Cyanobium sp. Morenito 9A2]|uniref:helix-turn-helix domain-containing protein n=1 Tax=Cyanobium sp. Morenito 9A2 TaxID=2823718 RepID=UPI0020CC3DE2|nr:XRE family transcriptional regulator [Cyanobium sp. Morenito 9A2]MCP9850840.1 ImmA/IrrE family metallo-endopeptidase [Cyanobium sp. Morenito 9A2]
MLRWARERAGRTRESLASKFAPLADWETGEARPTLKQLEAYAKAVHVPIGYLFLREPPEEIVPIPDFRTVADQPLRRASPDLLDTVYLCQQRQEWYRDDARQAGAQPLPFVGSLALGADVVRSAASIRTALGVDLEAQRRLPTWTDALRAFIEKADALGVLVMVSGVVGSNNRRALDPSEFRGFALADPVAPLVFINGADSKAAQMFTLAHELAHLWLGESALSDAQASEAPAQAVERWCNQVAAELLVPLAVFTAEQDTGADLQEELNRLARRFKVSTLVILRRMHDAGSLRGEAYWHAYNAELERLLELPGGSGGNFYLTLGARVSKRFARAVVSSTLEGRSSFTEAFRLLGFRKIDTFRQLSTSLGVAF